MSSGAARTPAWQRPDLVSTYLRERTTVLPLLDVQEDVVRRLLERNGHAFTRFLDVGGGDGAMTELVLSLHPEAQSVLVDFSEPMLEGARKRLAAHPNRWELVQADLSDAGWRTSLAPASFGAAVSALAIHHLTSERKRALFGELYELLEPGAIFVNMDHVAIEGPMRGVWEEQMVVNAMHADHRRGGHRSAEEIEGQLFDDDEDDRPDSVEEQLRWLREAGFEQVEVNFKWGEAAVFGAVKPGGGGG